MYVKFFEEILPNVQSKRNPKKIKNLKIYSVDGGLWCSLCGCKQIQQVLGKLNDLGAAELGGAIDAVHEGDGHLGDGVAMLSGPDQHLHLENIALGHAARDAFLQDILLVEPEGPSQITGIRTEENLGQKVGSPRDELALKVPAEDASITSVPSAGHNVVVSLLLQLDELRDELGLQRDKHIILTYYLSSSCYQCLHDDSNPHR